MPPRARSQEVIRHWRILRQLWESKYGRTVQQLADDVSIGKRTIQRDIVALQEAGFPLEQKERGAAAGLDAEQGRVHEPPSPQD